MPFDGITVAALAEELESSLKNARVDKIFQPQRFDLLLVLRAEGKQHKLFLSANPSSAAVYLTTQEKINPPNPPMFCMLLRKHLLGARLITVQAPDYERILILTFQQINEIGDLVEKKLYVETMGKHSNIILVNHEGKIHDAIVHVDQSISRVREVMPARTYQLPPKQDKLLPSQIAAKIKQDQAWINAAALSLPLEKAILASCMGFSPALCRHVLADANLDYKVRAINLSSSEKQRLDLAMMDLLSIISGKKWQPLLFYLAENDLLPVDFHAIRLNTYKIFRQASSLSEILDEYYYRHEQKNTLQQKRHFLQRRIDAQLQHVEKKFQIHLADRQEGKKSDTYRQYGDLLLTELQKVTAALKQGKNQVQVNNYFLLPNQTETIRLQKSKSASWNAQNYFNLYRKTKMKYETSQKLLQQDQEDITWLQSIKEAIVNADDLKDLGAIKFEMQVYGLLHDRKRIIDPAEENIDQGLIPAKPKQVYPGQPAKSKRKKYKYQQIKQGNRGINKKSTKQLDKPSFRSWYSSDGFEILAGRNNLQNDQLTLKTAQKHDMWLHVQKAAGTHVIIRTKGQDIPSSTLEQAAGIAAWFSKAGQTGASKLAVDYCLVSQVRKPKGARPGMVVYDNFKTLLIDPLNPQNLAQFSSENQIFPEK